MTRLTNGEFWNEAHRKDDKNIKGERSKSTLKKLIFRIFGSRILELRHNYPDYLLWDHIYQKHLPVERGLRAIEIGSAPGYHLVAANKRFGYDPYGIEYSQNGVEANREVFRKSGLNPDNVIFDDFFSDDFLKKYSGYFDIVFSRGFIEHFTNMDDVISRHIGLLKKGGYLIVSIPNLRGINYLLTRFFDKRLIAMHNLNIMRKSNFANLFDQECLQTLFCDYYGTFWFGLFQTKPASVKNFILAFCFKLQLLLNIIFRVLFRNKGKESSFFSPFLLFVGKRESENTPFDAGESKL
ncbi:MAG: methyltransferase domain-containing protein [Candidatus Zixiibacteriota bacterium]|nr:MAG: methyltransferase domain-containing protein [candidate division Zixibacteria bacterium]